MKRFYFIFFTLIFLALSCDRDGSVEYVIDGMSSNGNGKNTAPNLWIDGYQEVDSSSDYLVFPLWLGVFGQESWESSYASKRASPQNSYWNLLFYNPLNQEKHLLYQEKALILDFSPFAIDSPRVAADQFIFYKIIRQDFNADGNLDLKDPVQLFVSDKNGHNFRPLTPENRHLNGWKLYRNSPILLAEVREDTNHDSLFSHKDPTRYIRIDLSKESPGSPAFAPGYLDELEKQMKELFPIPTKDE